MKLFKIYYSNIIACFNYRKKYRVNLILILRINNICNNTIIIFTWF